MNGENKLEYKHIQNYDLSKLKVQYEGITNTKELSKCRREWNIKNKLVPLMEQETIELPKEVRGLKVGFIKIVEHWKSGIKYRIGNTTGGLQTHYNLSKIKPILRPLSDLTKYSVEEDISGDITLYDYIKKLWFITIREDGHFSHSNGDGTCTGYSYKSCDYSLIQLLLEHHFDVFGLIEKGLAIDINTLPNNGQ